MYTHKPSPGKFEGNSSQLLVEVVYQASLDGTSEEWNFGVDWSALINGKRFSFIIHEDNLGFIDVGIYDRRDPGQLAQLEQIKIELSNALDEISNERP